MGARVGGWDVGCVPVCVCVSLSVSVWSCVGGAGVGMEAVGSGTAMLLGVQALKQPLKLASLRYALDVTFSLMKICINHGLWALQVLAAGACSRHIQNCFACCSQTLCLSCLFRTTTLLPVCCAVLCAGTMSRAEIEQTYRMSRRIEGEERALDAAMEVFTSTNEEITKQWGLYNG